MNSDRDLAPGELVSPGSVGGFLSQAGLTSGPVEAHVLSGGVSNVVLDVSAGQRNLVVKQSLGRLRVAAEWHAPERRILAEAAALKVVGGIDPTSVPRVLHVDRRRMILVMERAPEPSEDWKSELLRQVIDPNLASRLGAVVGKLHKQTASLPLPSELEDDREAFEALRLEPYHETVARALPDVGGQIASIADRIRSTRVCLVHGDLSPKNVLVIRGGVGLWLIDFEVAQRGDPAFDLAFLVSHLVLKSLARPAGRAQYDRAADAFLAAYARVRGEVDYAWLSQQIGVLLLARVVGKSPVEYLDRTQQLQAVELGMSAVQGELTDLQGLRWKRDTK